MDRKSKVVTTHSSGESRRYRRVLGAKTLTGDHVRSVTGDNLGRVKEIMIDLQSGRVAYVVLSFGGFMGMADKLFAAPWDAFTIDEGNRELVIDATIQQLENAPGFAKDNWPDTPSPDWRTQIHGYQESTSRSPEHPRLIRMVNNGYSADRK